MGGKTCYVTQQAGGQAQTHLSQSGTPSLGPVTTTHLNLSPTWNSQTCPLPEPPFPGFT